MATLAIVPASGSVIKATTACRITVSGADDTDFTTYNAAHSPVEHPIPMVIVASKAGVDDLTSLAFNVSQDGHFVWDNLIFPSSGTWTLTLLDTRNDSTVATLSVVVSA